LKNGLNQKVSQSEKQDKGSCGGVTVFNKPENNPTHSDKRDEGCCRHMVRVPVTGKSSRDQSGQKGQNRSPVYIIHQNFHGGKKILKSFQHQSDNMCEQVSLQGGIRSPLKPASHV
jgi:hypothetical protein